MTEAQFETYKLGLRKHADIWSWKAVNDLVEEVEKLRRHIDKMSCCCAGCTKHNADIKVVKKITI